MQTVTIEFTDEQWTILKSCLLDPEEWIRNVANEKLRKVIDRVYEETTEKIAKKRTIDEKITELTTQYVIRARTEEDKAAILKHEPKISMEK
jgi:hypothetical protein